MFKPQPTTATEQWKDYSSRIFYGVEINKASVQYRETKRAFFAGLLSALAETVKITNQPKSSDLFIEFQNQVVTELEIMIFEDKAKLN